MCIRMIRYLTRFHCEKLRQCWKVKNAPATHTSHNVSQLSSLHATHYKKKESSTTQEFKADPGICSYHLLLSLSREDIGSTACFQPVGGW